MLRTVFRGIRDTLLILNITILIALGINKLSGCWTRPPPGWTPKKLQLRVEAHNGEDWAREAALAAHDADAHSVWDDHLLWQNPEYHSRYVNIEKDGNRVTVLPAAAQAKPAVNVAVFGGSTVFGYGGNRDEDTIPSRLAASLFRDGIAAKVVNLGIPGQQISQEIDHMLLEFHAGHHPDVCIFLDGLNEIYNSLAAGRPGALDESTLRTQRGLKTMMEPSIASSLRDIWHQTSLFELLHRVPDDKPALPPGFDDDVAQGYVIDVHAAEALAERFGCEAFFFWQPLLSTKQTTTPLEVQLNDLFTFPAWVKDHFDSFRTVTALVRKQLADDPHFKDLTTVLDSVHENVYSDNCHYTRAGNQTIADAIAQTIEPVVRARQAPHDGSVP